MATICSKSTNSSSRWICGRGERMLIEPPPAVTCWEMAAMACSPEPSMKSSSAKSSTTSLTANAIPMKQSIKIESIKIAMPPTSSSPWSITIALSPSRCAKDEKGNGEDRKSLRASDLVKTAASSAANWVSCSTSMTLQKLGPVTNNATGVWSDASTDNTADGTYPSTSISSAERTE